MRSAIALALLGAFFVVHAAEAQTAPMRFRLATVEAGNCRTGCAEIIVAEGVIEEDTPQAFVDFVNSAAEDRRARGVVLLSSPGGHVVASMELGEALREMGAAVIVARSFRAGGHDGVHRMSRQEPTSGGREVRAPTRTFASADVVGALGDYAAQMGVNPEVIRAAERISPDDIHILSGAEMRRWRIAR